MNEHLQHISKFKSIFQHLRQTPDQFALWNEIVDVFFQLLECQGVFLLKFSAEGHAEVLAEKTLYGFQFKGLTFHQEMLKQYQLPPFYKGLSLFVGDIDDIGSCNWLDDEYLISENVLEQKADFLAFWQLHYVWWRTHAHNLGFQSIILLPILQDGRIWGYIFGFYFQKKQLSNLQILSGEHLTQFLPSLIQLKEEQRWTDYNQHKEQLMSQLVEEISGIESFEEVLKNKEKELLMLAGASGAVLCVEEEVYFYGKCPTIDKVKDLRDWLSDQNKVSFTTNHLSKQFLPFETLKKIACGIFAIRLGDEKVNIDSKRDFLIWFRPEKHQVIRWISKLPVSEFNKNESTSAANYLFPHFYESVFGSSEKWNDSETHYLKEFQAILQKAILRKQKTEKEKDNIFKLLLQNSSDVVAIIEENFDIRFISDSAEKVFGVAPQEVIKRNVEMIHPEDLPLLADFLTRAIQSPSPIPPLVYRVKHTKGEYIYLETVASNQLNHPIIKGLIVNSRDITSRVKISKRLAKFEKIIENSKSGVLLVDASNKQYQVTYSNKSFFQITGYQENDIVSQSILFFLRKDTSADDWHIINEALENPKDLEFKIQTTHQATGKELLLEIQMFPMYDDKNNLTNFIFILTDTTNQNNIEKTLKEYSEKLKTSNEELETFAYVASHDLQEPLRTVMGFTELLSESYQNKLDNEGEQYIQFILQASQRMKNLIQDLLRFSRLGTGKEFIEEVNMNDVFKNAYENLYTSIEENNALITCDTLPTIMANYTLILQVMQNLMSNAIKYRKENESPIIHVSCEEHPEEWVFSVKDNGIGIAKKYYDRIFVIFQRLYTQEQYSGTGIGLAICKKVIEKYGGRIWVYSEEGKGSTFYFYVLKELRLF
jgi:PAS domain S-box-containing protein